MRGSACWTYDDEVKARYFGLNERSPPPYRKQIRVEAILDLDSDGRLAGVEIFNWSPNGAPIEPPIRRKGNDA